MQTAPDIIQQFNLAAQKEDIPISGLWGLVHLRQLCVELDKKYLERKIEYKDSKKRILSLYLEKKCDLEKNFQAEVKKYRESITRNWGLMAGKLPAVETDSTGHHKKMVHAEECYNKAAKSLEKINKIQSPFLFEIQNLHCEYLHLRALRSTLDFYNAEIQNYLCQLVLLQEILAHCKEKKQSLAHSLSVDPRVAPVPLESVEELSRMIAAKDLEDADLIQQLWWLDQTLPQLINPYTTEMNLSKKELLSLKQRVVRIQKEHLQTELDCLEMQMHASVISAKANLRLQQSHLVEMRTLQLNERKERCFSLADAKTTLQKARDEFAEISPALDEKLKCARDEYAHFLKGEMPCSNLPLAEIKIRELELEYSLSRLPLTVAELHFRFLSKMAKTERVARGEPQPLGVTFYGCLDVSSTTETPAPN